MLCRIETALDYSACIVCHMLPHPPDTAINKSTCKSRSDSREHSARLQPEVHGGGQTFSQHHYILGDDAWLLKLSGHRERTRECLNGGTCFRLLLAAHLLPQKPMCLFRAGTVICCRVSLGVGCMHCLLPCTFVSFPRPLLVRPQMMLVSHCACLQL